MGHWFFAHASLLFWLGLLVGGLGLLFSLAVLLLFACVPRPGVRSLPQTREPEAALVALAFTPQRMADTGLVPGPANEALADLVWKYAGRFDHVLVQEAILVALPPGTCVERIHAHDTSAYVRTYEALSWACQRLSAVGVRRIYLAVHDKQWDRAYRALSTMFDGEIVGPCRAGVPYEVLSEGILSWRTWWRPRLRWALRELACARPLEFIQGRLFRAHPHVSLPPF